MTDETTKQPKSGRGLRVALFLSVALNLLVVGLIGGAALRHHGGFVRSADLDPAFDAGVGPFGHALTRDQRRAFGTAIEGSRDAFARNRDEMRARLGDMLNALRATPFDIERLKLLVGEAQDGLIARQRIGTDALVAEIGSMSDAERAAFADRLEQSLRRIRPRR